LRSLLVVPVQGKERKFGTISVQSDELEAFTRDDEEVLTKFAVRAAIAIENAWLYERENRNRFWAEALAEASAVMTSSLDPEIVLDAILQQVGSVVSVDGQDIMMIDGDDVVIVRHYRYDGVFKDAESVKTIRMPISLSVYKDMIETGVPFVTPNIATIEDWVTIPGTEWIRSYASFPLKTSGKIIGFLNMVSRHENFFDQDTIFRLRIFADHASIALYNARLHEELKQALQNETAMRNRMLQNEHLASMGRMVSLIAHALNNPLQAIVNSIFLIEMDVPADSPVHEYLSIMTSDVNRLSGLVSQLRQVYKSSGAGEKTRVKLTQVLQEVRNLVEPQLVAKRMKWHQDSIPDTIMVSGIPAQLTQLFLNIGINAIEAMEVQKCGDLYITCEIKQGDKKIGVSIRDTGRGIDPQNIPDLFDPYYSTKATKIGLGLTVCDEIIKQHEGSIDIESQPGQGATFTVWLPLAEVL
jgi:signal transduction histidine kinase